MILQSLAKAVREQNYYAVLLEFLIVIAGIVIGFQVNAWNEERQIREREADYLGQMHVDVREMIANIERDDARLSRQIEDLEVSLDVLEGCRLDDDSTRSLNSALSSQWRMSLRYVVDATYREMLSGGALARMDNAELKEQINRTFSMAQRDAVGFPYYLSQVEDAAEVISNAVAFAVPEVADTADPGVRADFDHEVLCSDFQVTNALITLLRSSASQRQVGRVMLDELRTLETLLSDNPRTAR